MPDATSSFNDTAAAQNPPVPDVIRHAPLLEASAAGDAAGVARLLGEGFPANARNKKGQTALTLAAMGGHAAAMDLLLDAGASATNALSIAVRDNDYAATERLIACGAQAGERYINDRPLIMAVKHGNVPLAGMLLAAGAAPDTVNGIGETALMLAAEAGNCAMARQLLLHGADAGLRDIEGKTARMRGGSEAMLSLLASAEETAAEKAAFAAAHSRAAGRQGRLRQAAQRKVKL